MVDHPWVIFIISNVCMQMNVLQGYRVETNEIMEEVVMKRVGETLG